MTSTKKGTLVLEDNTVLEGNAFGACKSVSGEVVFNTAMTGYPESLTDPSYVGQILVLTYPLVGNYGVPEHELEADLFKNFESSQVQVAGLIISDYSSKYSHWSARNSLHVWLKENDVPAIFGLDTRFLTKRIRTKGTMLGKLLNQESDIPFYDPNKANLVSSVSVKEKKIYGNGKLKVLLLDCGVKNNIVRCLLARNCTVITVPWNHDISREDFDGLLISNGPGNPEYCRETIAGITYALDNDIPTFGICLGNQLLALAAGGKVFKLKFGHRSHNQPVLLKGTNRAFITSQNHGYAVETDSLPEEWKVLFTNINDGTVEGIKHRSKPFFSVQFHPEASGGPSDTMFLFDDFIEVIRKNKRTGNI